MTDKQWERQHQQDLRFTWVMLVLGVLFAASIIYEMHKLLNT